MLSFDPNGIAYPCLRYMPSSLGNNIKPIIIGSYKEGIYNTPASLQIKEDFLKITRKTQSTSTCFSCPIAAGCSYCSAWNYQCFGTANSRCINICWMHRACALANVYFWNNFYIKNNSDQSFSLYLDKETSIQIIGEQEYNKLL